MAHVLSLSLAAMSFAALACAHRPDASPRNDPSPAAAQAATGSCDGRGDANSSNEQGSASRDARIKDLEHFMSGVGWRFAHGPEDDELTSIVEAFMNKANIPLPANHRFVITKRKDGWGVFVVNFESFLRGDRLQFDTFHIGSKDGRPELLYIEAGI
jgi:hypothetical protein